MNKAIVVLFLFFSNLLIGQNTIIPDPIFEQELINQGYDIVLDGLVITTNIDTITSLNVTNVGINDLTGIEDFIALELFWCDGNNFLSLDFSQNVALTRLSCGWNFSLTSLNITQNINLTELYLEYNNALTFIDITQNTALTYLHTLGSALTSLNLTQNVNLTWLNSNGNSLTNIDLSQNGALQHLVLNNNDLTSLNLTQNPALTYVECMQNDSLSCLNLKSGNNTTLTTLVCCFQTSLTCITVDDPVWSNANWGAFNYSTNCPNLCLVGINEPNNLSYSIYPNPISTHFNIEGLNQTYNVNIYNTVGKLLYTKNNVIEPSKTIDVSQYAKGILFIRIEADGEVYYHKLIKN